MRYILNVRIIFTRMILLTEKTRSSLNGTLWSVKTASASSRVTDFTEP